MYFCFQSFFESFLLFRHVAYPFGFFVMFPWLPYFTQKLFSFSCIWLLAFFRVISPNLSVEFSFVVLECSFFLCCFTLCGYLLNLYSFTSTFWYISSSCIVIFSCVALTFCPNMFQRFSFILSFLPIFVVFLSAFPVEFHIQVLIFLFVLFKATPTFSQTNFDPS